MIKAEVSFYPMDSTELDNIAGLTTRFLEEHALDYDSYFGSTSLNTTIYGESDEVWHALRQLFQENQRQDREVIMVATLINWG
ncbi:MAG: hypothetical protein GX101_02520 [Firmicutes bacterium]|jgi:hypothetical protein|nr:hypothetical protein [Bacillota bacterium]NLO65545.1 hypothetical protein [Bacillota bacterium]